jgi:hypothetical protein
MTGVYTTKDGDDNIQDLSLKEETKELPKADILREVTFANQIKVYDRFIWAMAKRGRFRADINVDTVSECELEALMSYLEKKDYRVVLNKRMSKEGPILAIIWGPEKAMHPHITEDNGSGTNHA